jgi:hypothetical protein
MIYLCRNTDCPDEGPSWFPQSLYTTTGRVPRLCHDVFLQIFADSLFLYHPKIHRFVVSILKLTNSVALVRKRTIPTGRPPLVGEVSTNFCGYRGVEWSVRRIPYGRNDDFLDRTLLVHSHKVLH